MIVRRAQKHLEDPADIADLEISKLVGAISFDLHPGEGTQDLKDQIIQGIPTEEPVRAGIKEKLAEILALLSCFRWQDPEIWSH